MQKQYFKEAISAEIFHFKECRLCGRFASRKNSRKVFNDFKN